MRAGPAIMLSVAFVCAGFAAILVRNMLSASHDSPATAAVVAPAAAEKTILVAARDLRPGQKLTVDLVREVSVPVTLLPKGAFLSKDALFKPGDDHFLSVGLAENEPILAAKFTNAVTSDASVDEKASMGMTAFKIRLNETSAVGAVVQPGDWVDILVTQTERVAEGAPSGNSSIVPLVQHVRVLATEQAKKGASQMPQSVTVEVNADEASILTLAPTAGQLAIILSRGSKNQKNLPINIKDVLRGVGGSSSPTQKEPVVTVIRTIDVQQYSVQSEVKK